MSLKWKVAHYADVMPAQFMSNGLVTSDGRFFVGARYAKSSGSHLNWGAMDFRKEIYADGFRYRRDAQAFVEKGWAL